MSATTLRAILTATEDRPLLAAERAQLAAALDVIDGVIHRRPGIGAEVRVVLLLKLSGAVRRAVLSSERLDAEGVDVVVTTLHGATAMLQIKASARSEPPVRLAFWPRWERRTGVKVALACIPRSLADEQALERALAAVRLAEDS